MDHSADQNASAAASEVRVEASFDTGLEKVRDRMHGEIYAVRITVPKVTSSCPMTGRPMQAHVVVDYVPNGWLIETNSLHRYLDRFRYFGAFHETTTLTIGKEIAAFIEPTWLRVGGYWRSFQGVPVEVFYQTGCIPKGIWVPEQPMPPTDVPH